MDPNNGRDMFFAVRKALNEKVAVEKDRNLWPEPESDKTDAQVFFSKDLTEGHDDLISRMVREICGIVKFPRSTAFLHAIGVIAGAMTKSFQYKGGPAGSSYVTLYTLGSQPAGTGKSAINKAFFMPIRDRYEELNRLNRKERKMLTLKIEALEEQLSKATNDIEISELLDSIEDCKLLMNKAPDYIAAVTNATVEALEVMARTQDGMFNIVSDEAGSINTILGLTYGGGNDKSNMDSILQGWDNDYISTLRVGRKGYHGCIRGSVNVIAQEGIIDSIIAAGIRGDGTTERFLLCLEPDGMGFKEYEFSKVKLSDDFNKLYPALIRNIIMEKGCTLIVDDEGQKFLVKLQNWTNQFIRPGGKWSPKLIRGFITKGPKHIVKIASVLHAIEQWMPKYTTDDYGNVEIEHFNTGKNMVIDIKHIKRASEIFMACADMYMRLAEAKGGAGMKSEVDVVRDKIKVRAERGQRLLTKKIITDDVKRLALFKNKDKVGTYIFEYIMPLLERDGVCFVNGSDVYVNPKFA